LNPCVSGKGEYLTKEKSKQKPADKVSEIIHDDVILTRISTTARENIRLES
jgi:hypothetical protein